MKQLPIDNNVDVGRLSSCFKHTAATYKFYWFLSILESIEQGKDRIKKQELFARMIANAWYTVNYFHVSFGKNDNIQDAVNMLKEEEGLSIDLSKEKMITRLINSTNRITQKQLNHFDKQVPHYFLSPWIGSKGSKTSLTELSQERKNFPPYILYEREIHIEPDWLEYFKRNSGILKDFCYWNLSMFLQRRNPNVPDIPGKLKRPEKRGSLAKHKKDFWDIVIDELGGVDCIYSGKKMIKGNYAVEHFIPFQFVTHDQMWNLVPADPSFNSSKGDKLPSIAKYFDSFYELQKEGISIVHKYNPDNRFLEDYLTVFKTLDITKDQYIDCIEPMITIASNNGFQFMS